MSCRMEHTFLSTRRRFLRNSVGAALAAPYVTSGLRAVSPNGKLRHASFGASGMAWADIQSLTASEHVELAAVADVDARRLGEVKAAFPGVHVYADWRELLEHEGERIDTVNVSTPDHMHGPIALAAMGLGKHVYCQKPLAQNLAECRLMRETASKKGVMSQMGIQVSSMFTERLAVQLVRDGVIGKVKEVHTFSEKQWGDPAPRPQRSDPVPEGLDWDLWLGVATERPYLEGYYHPGAWRKRRDFGTGTLGDMGCHIFSGWFRALDLTAPRSVESFGPASNAGNWAIDSRIEYVFPGTAQTAEESVRVVWYDGAQRPPEETGALVGGRVPGQGSILIGTEGVLLAPHMETPKLYPEDKHQGFRFPRLEPRDHYLEFVESCRTGQAGPSAAFDYSGPLTEAVLLGCLSTLFAGQRLDWDAGRMEITNQEEANAQVRRVYRDGWAPEGLAG
ncbi:MAG TPA: Gfo/Idh/MocA family oxidoreductase [Verrucomicrobiales bacterium]|nr:Gfo/Idh/MocA family oxidoreductase [Verrucomicrobiales bacterium]